MINLDKKLELLKKEIMSDSDNKKYTDEGIEPLFLIVLIFYPN